MMTQMKRRITFHQGLHCGFSEIEIQYFLELLEHVTPQYMYNGWSWLNCTLLYERFHWFEKVKTFNAARINKADSDFYGFLPASKHYRPPSARQQNAIQIAFHWRAYCCRFYMLISIWAAASDFQQCGILTSVDSDQPVQPPFKLWNSKWCSVSSLTVI